MDGNTVSVERVIKAPPSEIFALPADATNTVIEYEPDRRIAWQTFGMRGPVGGRIWRYELTPAEGAAGTMVRESWDVSRDKQKRMITSGSMPRQPNRAWPRRWSGSPRCWKANAGLPVEPVADEAGVAGGG